MESKNEILIKVITDNASPEEVLEVNAWLNESAANKEQFQYLKAVWNQSVEQVSGSAFNPDENKAWDLVSKKMEQKPKHNYVWEIAASFVVLCILGVFLKYFIASFEPEVAIHQPKIEKISIPETKVEPEPIKIITHTISSNKEVMEKLLEDSSLVILNENSKISYPDFEQTGKRSLHLDGQAYFDVVPSNKDFMVTTDFVKVKVVGTAFSVNEITSDQLVEVTVDEGTVEAFELNNKKNKVSIHAKEKYSYDIKKHVFKKINTGKKHWWNKFFSKLQHFLDRIKHRKRDKKE